MDNNRTVKSRKYHRAPRYYIIVSIYQLAVVVSGALTKLSSGPSDLMTRGMGSPSSDSSPSSAMVFCCIVCVSGSSIGVATFGACDSVFTFDVAVLSVLAVDGLDVMSRVSRARATIAAGFPPVD